MLIRCRNINKSFGDRILFLNYNLEINQGDFVCIYGKSGCGKSTLLNMIGSLEKPTSGQIEILSDGRVYNTLQHYRQIRNKFVNFVFQNFALIQSKTVKYNLLFSMQEMKISKVEKLKIIEVELEKVGLLDRLESLVYELSGGEQQRVALVRALLKPGDFILADEPTGNLDAENKEIVLELMKSIHNQGKTVIVVTHDEDFKEYATKIIEL